MYLSGLLRYKLGRESGKMESPLRGGDSSFQILPPPTLLFPDTEGRAIVKQGQAPQRWLFPDSPPPPTTEAVYAPHLRSCPRCGGWTGFLCLFQMVRIGETGVEVLYGDKAFRMCQECNRKVMAKLGPVREVGTRVWLMPWDLERVGRP